MNETEIEDGNEDGNEDEKGYGRRSQINWFGVAAVLTAIAAIIAAWKG